jgi:hypothetical protein
VTEQDNARLLERLMKVVDHGIKVGQVARHRDLGQEGWKNRA